MPIVAASTLLVAACGLSGPPPAEYVLGASPPARTATTPITSLPVVEVRQARLPDYLDTKSLFVRAGNELKPSATGRWGERLSVGVTRAVAAALAARLPEMAVTAAPPVEPPALQVLLDVDAFEATAGQGVVFAGTWTITNGPGRTTLHAERFSVNLRIAGTADHAVVAAMSRAVDDLAARVAVGIEKARGSAPGPR